MATRPKKWEINPLTHNTRIAKDDGTPEPFFMQQWNLLLALVKQVTNVSAFAIETTAPIEGGGLLVDGVDISHADSGATPGTYGDATNVPQITVNAFGHVTGVVDIPITGGGGAAWTLVDTHDFTAAPQLNWDVDVTGYADVIVILQNTVASGTSGQRKVQLSDDGGATFYSTNEYQLESAAGATSSETGFSIQSANDNTSRSGHVQISGLQTTGTPRSALGNRGAYRFNPTTAIDFLRVTTSPGTSITAGLGYVLAR